MSEEQVQPYAKCIDCDLELANREELSEHLKSTYVRPTNAELLAAGGVLAAGHKAQVVNPTPEERQERRVRSAIETLVDELYDDLDRQVQHGDFTEDEVREQMKWFDLADGWDDYVSEAGG